MTNKIIFVLGALLISAAANATCMIQSCVDSDHGNFPNIPGSVTITSTCSPPGGPSTTVVDTFTDFCKNGSSTEYTCNGHTGMLSVGTVVTACRKCHPRGKKCNDRCGHGNCGDHDDNDRVDTTVPEADLNTSSKE